MTVMMIYTRLQMQRQKIKKYIIKIIHPCIFYNIIYNIMYTFNVYIERGFCVDTLRTVYETRGMIFTWEFL